MHATLELEPMMMTLLCLLLITPPVQGVMHISGLGTPLWDAITCLDAHFAMFPVLLPEGKL